MLHAWLVRATVAPASILRIDAAAARAMPGVADVIFASDLPPGGQNALGPVAKDEECFADGHASHVGQARRALARRDISRLNRDGPRGTETS